MNETQKLIKASIEAESRRLINGKVMVEYVVDVSERVGELEEQCGVNFASTYDAGRVTGTFIPAVNNNPYYILVQKDRNDMLDVLTVFHEYKHLLDYDLFLRTVFDGNTELLKKSPLYITFNVYSEYAATLFGNQQYIKCVQIEGLSQKELAKRILQNGKSTYLNFHGINNRYQLLIHSLQYLGIIDACSKYVDEICIQDLIGEMELSNELLPIIEQLSLFENKREWYEKVDEIMRDFVDGCDGS